MRGDQRGIHVARVGGGVAQPLKPLNLRERLEKRREISGASCGIRAMIGVDVLPEQHDLADARLDHLPGFGNDGGQRARGLCSARERHDAERAELVAAFLHGEEGCRPARHQPLATGRGQVSEFVFLGKLGVDRPALPGARLCDEIRQAMVALRANDDINAALPADDLLAFRLRDTAGDGDQRFLALGCADALGHTQAAKLGIDLLGGLLADMAGVEDDEIGILGAFGRGEALAGQYVRHALGVMSVHLAAVGLDVDAPRPRFGHRPRGGIKRALRSVGHLWFFNRPAPVFKGGGPIFVPKCGLIRRFAEDGQ